MKQFRISWYIVLLASATLILSGCWLDRATPTTSDYSLRPCLVDLSDFPSGWSIPNGPGPFRSPDQILPGRALAGVSTSFGHGESNAIARHAVLAYKTERQAAREFNRQQPETYFSAGRLTPWETPAGISYVSPVADQFRLSCAEIDGHAQVFNHCIAMGQYGTHLSTFATWVSPDYMTYADLEHILAAIDERMAACSGVLVTNPPATTLNSGS